MHRIPIYKTFMHTIAVTQVAAVSLPTQAFEDLGAACDAAGVNRARLGERGGRPGLVDGSLLLDTLLVGPSVLAVTAPRNGSATLDGKQCNEVRYTAALSFRVE